MYHNSAVVVDPSVNAKTSLAKRKAADAEDEGDPKCRITAAFREETYWEVGMPVAIFR